MRSVPMLCLVALLVGCGHATAAAPASAPSKATSSQAAGVPQLGAQGGTITLQSLDTPFVKDPSFVDDGRLLGDRRYIAFGDLRTLYVKPFQLDDGARARTLRFLNGEVPLRLQGLPANLDSPWAPHLVVMGDRMLLLYCAGEMPPPEPPRWGTFRLRLASMSKADFIRQARAGEPLSFRDQGTLLTDLAPFGPADEDFGVIDPQLFVNPRGRAYMTYTVVRGGIPGKRAHEEFVRYRQVSAIDPARALGPDRPMYDGRWPSEDDGVAEAQEVVTLSGRTFAIVSSRPGDIDQRLMVAPVPAELGRIAPGTLQPLMLPGAEPWRASAVGSSGTAVIEGTPFMLYQGLSAGRRFTLGWRTLIL